MFWNYSFTRVCHFSLCYIESAVLWVGENGKSISVVCGIDCLHLRVSCWCFWCSRALKYQSHSWFSNNGIHKIVSVLFTSQEQLWSFDFMHVAALCCDSSVCLVLSLVRKASANSGLADGWRMSEWWWRVCVWHMMLTCVRCLLRCKGGRRRREREGLCEWERERKKGRGEGEGKGYTTQTCTGQLHIRWWMSTCTIQSTHGQLQQLGSKC